MVVISEKQDAGLKRVAYLAPIWVRLCDVWDFIDVAVSQRDMWLTPVTRYCNDLINALVINGHDLFLSCQAAKLVPGKTHCDIIQGYDVFLSRLVLSSRQTGDRDNLLRHSSRSCPDLSCRPTKLVPLMSYRENPLPHKGEMMDVGMILLCLVLVALILLYIILPYKFKSRRARKLTDKIPGPPGLPYLGNILMFNGPHEDTIPIVMRLCDEYGTIWKIRNLGEDLVFLTNEEDIEQLLSNAKYITKSVIYKLLTPWLNDGLLLSTGVKWHSHRKLLTPTFHFKILEEFIPIFNKNSNILVEKLSEYVDKGYVPINKLVSLCTLDIICETAMGTCINAQTSSENEYAKAVLRISELIFHRLLSPWLWRPFTLFLSPTGWEQRKTLRTLHGFTEKVIKERRAEYKEAAKKHGSFPDQLNNTKVAEREEIISNKEIREEVDTFMFEVLYQMFQGHDTTSAGISWALYLLGRNPHVQDRVVEELQGIFGDSKRPATFSDLQAMRYLEQVIKESLRLYPSVPFYGRYLEDDIIIKNYTIPAGTDVNVFPIHIHRNPRIYPDPEVFNPDRFSKESSQERHPFAYLPFSAGPRNCIGQRFALLEEKAVLSTVLRNFQIESLERPEDIAVMGELVLRPKHELRIKFTLRN
uniref:Cytochrome P450 n=1 Tax=Timema monikensis TaxID=170555 RepID=A0A7R9EE38_9NEOP|nr:unnamed protein product [Timema monikensis]